MPKKAGTRHLARALLGLCAVVLASPLFAQTPETLHSLLEDHRLEEIKRRLPDLVRRFPDNPTVIFLQGVVESDGARAVTYYKRVVEEFPSSAFADEALLRLIQYDLAQGLYHSAAQRCLRLTTQYSNSPLCDDAHYLRIQCLFARGDRDSAAYSAEWFLRRYPDSPFAQLVASELASVSVPRAPTGKPGSGGRAFYGVQVGAFKERGNAERLVRALAREGYACEVVTKERGRDLFYLVWVGRFEGEEAAMRLGKELQERYGLPFRIVQR